MFKKEEMMALQTIWKMKENFYTVFARIKNFSHSQLAIQRDYNF